MLKEKTFDGELPNFFYEKTPVWSHDIVDQLVGGLCWTAVVLVLLLKLAGEYLIIMAIFNFVKAYAF